MVQGRHCDQPVPAPEAGDHGGNSGRDMRCIGILAQQTARLGAAQRADLDRAARKVGADADPETAVPKLFLARRHG